MKIEVSKSVIETLKKYHKNADYSLSAFVQSLDFSSAKDVYALAQNVDLGTEKVACEIDQDTIKVINQLFGNSDSKLIEVLIWISAFLPEI